MTLSTDRDAGAPSQPERDSSLCVPYSGTTSEKFPMAVAQSSSFIGGGAGVSSFDLYGGSHGSADVIPANFYDSILEMVKLVSCTDSRPCNLLRNVLIESVRRSPNLGH